MERSSGYKSRPLALKDPRIRRIGTSPTATIAFSIWTSLPSDAAERRQYAADVLRRFCLRAYRRPVDESHLSRLLELAGFSAPTRRRSSGHSSDSLTFEQRIGRAITAVLASPRFLFRVDQPQAGSAEMFPEVDEYSLASRLSYFLWSTMPDEELLQLAERGALKENLSEQVERMLRDERSNRLIKNFVGQWLQTRDVESVSIDPLAAQGVREEYERLSDYLESTETRAGHATGRCVAGTPRRLPAVSRDPRTEGRLDGEVRRDMAGETERLFAYVLRENRSLDRTD